MNFILLTLVSGYCSLAFDLLTYEQQAQIIYEQRHFPKPIFKCTSEQFRCKTQHRCIPMSNYCDNWPDCEDGSDEKYEDCIKLPDLFSCSDLRTSKPFNFFLKSEFVCDGCNDCPHGDDEFESLCKSHEKMPPFYQCKNGRCLPRSLRCNNKYECGPGDKSDEEHCSLTLPPTGNEIEFRREDNMVSETPVDKLNSPAEPTRETATE